jgi:hypothetical protein
MSTRLVTPVSRETSAKIFERSKNREIIVTLEPPCQIGTRLKGTKRTYWLDADTVYYLAVKAAMTEKGKGKFSKKEKA